MPRPQFSLKTMLWLMLVAAAFFGGIRFERERRRQADDAAYMQRNSDILQRLLSSNLLPYIEQVPLEQLPRSGARE